MQRLRKYQEFAARRPQEATIPASKRFGPKWLRSGRGSLTRRRGARANTRTFDAMRWTLATRALPAILRPAAPAYRRGWSGASCAKTHVRGRLRCSPILKGGFAALLHLTLCTLCRKLPACEFINPHPCTSRRHHTRSLICACRFHSMSGRAAVHLANIPPQPWSATAGCFFSITRYAAAMANAPMPKLRNPPIVEAVFDVGCRTTAPAVSAVRTRLLV